METVVWMFRELWVLMRFPEHTCIVEHLFLYGCSYYTMHIMEVTYKVNVYNGYALQWLWRRFYCGMIGWRLFFARKMLTAYNAKFTMCMQKRVTNRVAAAVAAIVVVRLKRVVTKVDLFTYRPKCIIALHTNLNHFSENIHVLCTDSRSLSLSLSLNWRWQSQEQFY